MTSDAKPLHLHPDRLFPSDPAQRPIARRLYTQVAGLPIISPHGHTDPAWFAGEAHWLSLAAGLLSIYLVYRVARRIGLERAPSAAAGCTVYS